MAFSKNVVILQGEYSCSKLQGPLFQNSKEKYVPGEKVPVWTDEGWGEVLFHGPHPPSGTAPLPEGEGYSLDDGFCDSALRLRAE